MAGVSKIRSTRPRPLRWLPWICIPGGAFGYTALCLAFALEAWGRRGEVKPTWFEVMAWLAMPGLFCSVLGPPGVMGPPGIGGAAGWLFATLVRWLAGRWLVRHREREAPLTQD